MDLINQGDIFLCVNKIFKVRYEQMAFTLSEINGAISKDVTWVNKCARQHVPGDEIFKNKYTEFYEKFFEPYIKNEAFEKQEIIQEWLLKNNLKFTGMNDEKYKSPEKWFRQMIKCALSNWTLCREPISRRKKIKLKDYIFPTQKFFIGREKIINEIKNRLEEKHIVILTGTAGIGKSTVARNFAMTYKKNYSCVQEVVSDFSVTPPKKNKKNHSSLFAVISKVFIEGLNIGKAKNEDDVFELKLDAIKKIKSPTLLIFDGIKAQPDDLGILTDLLRYTKIQIIITARNLKFLEALPHIKIMPLSPREQIELFEHHYGRKLTKDDDMKFVKSILQYCDGGTLYIEHLARYIQIHELTFEEAYNMLQECDPFPESWYIQKDTKVFTDETFYGTFLKILFPNAITNSRKKVLKALSLLPFEGVSRRLIFDVLGKSMQNEIISLENEGYVMQDVMEGRTVTRIAPILQNLVRWAFFKKEKDCGEFLEGLYIFMRDSELKNVELDIYAIAMNILDSMKLKEFDSEILEKWLEGFKKFFNLRASHLEQYKKELLFRKIDNVLKRINN